jgi:hypothetical protein
MQEQVISDKRLCSAKYGEQYSICRAKQFVSVNVPLHAQALLLQNVRAMFCKLGFQ